MPGVGVVPGLNGFFSSSSLGMPGVGVVPFGNGPEFAGIPGAELTGSGVAENSFGTFAVTELDTLFDVDPLLVTAAPPQPADTSAADPMNKEMRYLDIVIIRTRPQKSCAGSSVASPGGSDGDQTGTGG